MNMEPQTLIEQPNGRHTLYAAVEQDDRTAYFYLFPAELQSKKYKMRACWLRNLLPAPEVKDVAAMHNGTAPMLQAKYCNHPDGKEPLNAELLEIVWLPEDDGAAVLSDGEILGVIPGWSLYVDEAVSYAADCIGVEGDDFLVLPLGDPASNQQYARVGEAVAFRNQWSSVDEPAWPQIQESFINCYEAQFGKMLQYFAIDNNEWPPMAMGKFEKDNIVYFLTMGASIRPMPWVSYLYNDTSAAYRRMELALAVDKSEFSEEEIMKMAESIATMADIPWRHISWLGEGHTIGSSKLPEPYESMILSSALYNGAAFEVPAMYGDKVNLFWASPVMQQEREFAHRKPNGGYELLEIMIQKDVTHVVKNRKSVL